MNNFNIINEIPKDNMSKQEFYQCLKQAKAGSKSASEEFIKQNIKLVISRIRKKFRNHIEIQDELISIGLLSLLKSIQNFDLNKGYEFSTYAAIYIDYAIINFLKEKKLKDEKEISIDANIFQTDLTLGDVLKSEVDIVADYETKEEYAEIRNIVETLPLKEKIIIKLYFGFIDGVTHSQREIAQEINLSQSHVCRIINKTLKEIKNHLECSKQLILKK